MNVSETKSLEVFHLFSPHEMLYDTSMALIQLYSLL